MKSAVNGIIGNDLKTIASHGARWASVFVIFAQVILKDLWSRVMTYFRIYLDSNIVTKLLSQTVSIHFG